MPEKVKFSKEVYRGLKAYGLPENGGEAWPMGEIKNLYVFWENYASSVLGTFIDGGIDNQWKLIDALRNGYEAEPEQLYYVMFVKRDHNRPSRFLNKNMENGELFIDDVFETANVKTKFTMPEIEAIDPRYKAFAVKVEEVDNDD